MIIKSSTVDTLGILHPVLHFIGRLRKSALVMIVLAMVILSATSLSSIYYGMHLYKVKAADSFGTFFENAIQSKLAIVPNFVKGRLLADPERITIDMKHKNFQKLAYKRQIALATQILMTTDDDYVPAKIRYQDRTFDVKIRLKGDWIDHLLGDKWSYRIALKGDETIFGMKQFSIHQPQSRNYIYEWIYHQALRRENILALRYDFIEVTLNGRDLGVYALEEHFEKRVIEHNRFREGPILKFNEELLWADRAEHYLFGALSPTGLQAERVGAIDVFKPNRTMSDPGLRQQFMVANMLLDAFRYKRLPASKVFEVDKLAMFFALADVLGSTHSAVWHNLRFYYNPITSLLEPIGFDANAGHRTVQVIGSNRDMEGDAEPYKFKDIAFADERLFAAYVNALQKVSAPAYVDSLLADLGPELERKLNIIYRDEPQFYFTKQVFHENQRTIRRTLHPVKGLHAYCQEASGNRLVLDLGNIQAMPIEVLSASLKDELFFAPRQRIVLQPLLPSAPVAYQRFDFDCPAGFAWSDTARAGLKINYRILGAGGHRQDAVFTWPRQNDLLDMDDLMRQEPNAGRFDFLTVDDSTRRIFIQPGAWEVDENLIIPRGYRVICGGGTRIALSKSAMILSFSAFSFLGSEESPIVIESVDSTGQGLAILNARETSVFEHVRFENLSNPSQTGWALTGAVTFYESPVRAMHCQIIGNRCEDGMNVFRSAFDLNHTLFQRTAADAFDADFSNGTIANSSFLACGNDAIDVSGSVMEVSNLLIAGAGDKGISGGEDSKVTARNVEIRQAEIAVASKDKTEFSVHGISLTRCGIGFAAYRKKPEFGVASIAATKVRTSECRAPYLIEEGSSMTVDGAVIPADRTNVESILYGVEFGKASKPATN